MKDSEQTMLEIKNLHVTVDGKAILKGVDLTIQAGQIHAIMGPNGSGKSTLGNAIAGRDGYEVTRGEVLYKGKNLLELTPEVRACEGIFLAFQYPVEIPGVNNTYFLRAALNAQRKYRGEPELDSMQFLKLVREKLKILHISDDLLPNWAFRAATTDPYLIRFGQTDIINQSKAIFEAKSDPFQHGAGDMSAGMARCQSDESAACGIPSRCSFPKMCSSM